MLNDRRNTQPSSREGHRFRAAYAMSGGTLIALAADEIVMDRREAPFGAHGPGQGGALAEKLATAPGTLD